MPNLQFKDMQGFGGNGTVWLMNKIWKKLAAERRKNHFLQKAIFINRFTRCHQVNEHMRWRFLTSLIQGKEKSFIWMLSTVYTFFPSLMHFMDAVLVASMAAVALCFLIQSWFGFSFVRFFFVFRHNRKSSHQIVWSGSAETTATTTTAEKWLLYSTIEEK